MDRWRPQKSRPSRVVPHGLIRISEVPAVGLEVAVLPVQREWA